MTRTLWTAVLLSLSTLGAPPHAQTAPLPRDRELPHPARRGFYRLLTKTYRLSV